MTRRANARLAGFTFLFYIAVAFPSMILSNRATAGAGIPAKLATLREHVMDMRLTVVLTLLSGLCALTLAVTLYAITRDEDRDLARLGMLCRAGEGIIGSFAVSTLGLIWLATAGDVSSPDAAGAAALASFFLKRDVWSYGTAAFLFSVGSTLFAFLMLRGRMIPSAMAWLGVVGSLLVVIELPLELAGFVRGPLTQLVWIPVALFELTLGPWLIIKGVAPSRGEVA
ncbi:MAG: DUF4386 domain-containing protein [Gemmatimonadaceae bacterium]